MVQSLRVEVQRVNGDVGVRARFASVEEVLGVLDHLLRRRDGAQVPATFGTFDPLAQLRGRGHAAEVEAGVFRITAAGRHALRAAG